MTIRALLSLVPLFAIIGCGFRAPREPVVLCTKVEYRADKEKATGVLCRPAAGPSPGVIFIHGEHGLTAWEKDRAERLAARGYVVLAVDLYRGEVMEGVMDAHVMGRGLPEERALADLKAAADFLARHPDVRPDHLGVIGWDMGCGYALDAARHDPRLRAAAVCEGRLITDADALRPMQARVLAVFAGKDEGVSKTTLDQFRAAMAKADRRLSDVRVYDNAGHGFMNPAEDPSPAAAADAADAWERIFDFFDAELKRP